METKRRNPACVGWCLALALLLGGAEAFAQDVPPPPPPPPPQTADAPPPPPEHNPLLRARPPVPVVIVGRGPLSPAALPPPLPRRQPRYKPSPMGRFYLGAGAGYLWPSGTLGEKYDSGGAFTLWTGWRKRWLGFELGYLGAQLTRRLGESPVIMTGGAPDANAAIYDPYAGDAVFTQLTSDVKVFLTVFCRSSIWARLGLNYTVLDYGSSYVRDGFGWQTGLGWDYRIRLSFAPNLVMKLRSETLYTWAKIKCSQTGTCQDISGVGLLFSVNLGWSPR